MLQKDNGRDRQRPLFLNERGHLTDNLAKKVKVGYVSAVKLGGSSHRQVKKYIVEPYYGKRNYLRKY